MSNVSGGLVKAWLSDYISYIYVDIILYPCNRLKVGLANPCQWKGSQIRNAYEDRNAEGFGP